MVTVERFFDMNMTKTGLWQYSTWATKNAHSATCTFSRHARFLKIRSHVLDWRGVQCLVRQYYKVKAKEVKLVLSSVNWRLPSSYGSFLLCNPKLYSQQLRHLQMRALKCLYSRMSRYILRHALQGTMLGTSRLLCWSQTTIISSRSLNNPPQLKGFALPGQECGESS